MADEKVVAVDGGNQATFHCFRECPAELRLNIIKEAVQAQQFIPGRLPLLACVGAEWQKEVERVTFRTLKRVLANDVDDMARICVGARLNCIHDIRLCVEVPNTYLDPNTSPAEMAARVSNPDAALTEFISNATTQAMTKILSIFKDCKKEDRFRGNGLGFSLAVAPVDNSGRLSPPGETPRSSLLRLQNVIVHLDFDALQSVDVLTRLNLGAGSETVAFTWSCLVSLLQKLPSLAELSFEQCPRRTSTSMHGERPEKSTSPPVESLSKLVPNVKALTIQSWEVFLPIPHDIPRSTLQHVMSLSHSLTTLELYRISGAAAFFDLCVKTSKTRGRPVWQVLTFLSVRGPRLSHAHEGEVMDQIWRRTIESFAAAIWTMPALRAAVLFPFVAFPDVQQQPQLILDPGRPLKPIQGANSALHISIDAWRPLTGSGISDLLQAVKKTHGVSAKVRWRKPNNDDPKDDSGWHDWEETQSDDDEPDAISQEDNSDGQGNTGDQAAIEDQGNLEGQGDAKGLGNADGQGSYEGQVNT